MRKINIIGAGQSGLQLGIGLLKQGYDVTIYSDRTPEQIYNGTVMSTQCMFHTALQHERARGCANGKCHGAKNPDLFLVHRLPSPSLRR